MGRRAGDELEDWVKLAPKMLYERIRPSGNVRSLAVDCGEFEVDMLGDCV